MRRPIRGSVLWLRLVLEFCACVRSMLLFPQTQIIVSTRLPALTCTPAPSLYTPAPVSMIGYTTYAFRHWGSDFLIRATETSTSRYRITSLPYQFFLLSPSKNTPPHSTIRVHVRRRAFPPPKNEKNVSNVSPLKPKSPFD